jgi:lipopolysaccharide transport system ATP-binding protein
MAVAIRATGLGKRYTLGPRERYVALRDQIMRVLRSPFGGNGAGETFWALKDVSFEVPHGEAIGLIGRNGAGKSTLLKVLSRITRPTEGEADIFGRVGSLLEVGTGFHPELTGRENVYLNGAILGMRRVEIDRKFDEIVAFAEVERFLDTPVKHYSSGMYTRLAFAVAAHLEPEILLVDEVLAVGDAAFQKKCLGKMGEVARQGRTVVFVSHNMGAIRTLCRRALWIADGRIVADGPADAVVSKYLDDVQRGFVQSEAKPDEALAIERVVLRDGAGEATTDFPIGADITVEVHYRARKRLEQPYLWIAVESQHGALFMANMLFDGRRPDALEGAGTIACTFKAPPLLPQVYTVLFGARAKDGVSFLTRSRDVAFFKVGGVLADAGLPGEPGEMLANESTPLVLPYEWRMPDGARVPVSVRGRPA